MPLSYKIDHGKLFVTVQATGLLTLDDSLVSYDALVVQEAMACGAMRPAKMFRSRTRALKWLGDEKEA